MYVFTALSKKEGVALSIFALVFSLFHHSLGRSMLRDSCLLIPPQLTAQTQRSTIHQSSRAQSSIAAADAEIARFRDILRQIDDLETEFDKVRHIRDIVKGFRSRVEGLERRVVVVDGRGTAMRGRR